MTSCTPGDKKQDMQKRGANIQHNTILLHLEQIKRIDMKISIDIAGIANCTVRDKNGNLLPFVWTRQSVYNEFENATLLTREALQKHLQTFIDAGVAQNIDLLQKVNDPAMLVDWVVRTAEYWEKRYAEKRNEKYDISQEVLSVISEVVSETAWPVLTEHSNLKAFETDLYSKIEHMTTSPGSNPYHKRILQQVSMSASADERKLESFFWIHRGHNALVRLLFRTDCMPELREKLCLLAGKLLQKKEVCNKPGTYASQRQRSDVLQEWFYAVRDFGFWCAENADSVQTKLQNLFNDDAWIFLVIDHTAIPFSLSLISSQDVSMDHAMLCESCRETYASHKRQREAQTLSD